MIHLKQLGCILALCMMLIITVAPAMASDGGGGARVIDVNGNDVTDENRVTTGDSTVTRSVDTSKDDNSGIKPEDIYSDSKVIGQDVGTGNWKDLFNVKKWVSLLFVNAYVTAIAGLVFAVVGLFVLSGSGLAILLNAGQMVWAMLDVNGDVDDKVDKVHSHEKCTLTLIRGLGVTFISLSFFCFMVTFFG